MSFYMGEGPNKKEIETTGIILADNKKLKTKLDFFGPFLKTYLVFIIIIMEIV